jgi:hypothetical protein
MTVRSARAVRKLFLWYWPGSTSAGFGSAHIGPNRQFFSGHKPDLLPYYPNQQHNFLPFTHAIVCELSLWWEQSTLVRKGYGQNCPHYRGPISLVCHLLIRILP